MVAHAGLQPSVRSPTGWVGEALRRVVPWSGGGFPVHDRGKILVQMAPALAGSGESCLDVEHLRIGDDVFGSVPSETTVARTFHEIAPETRTAIAEATAGVKAEVWRRSAIRSDRNHDVGNCQPSQVRSCRSDHQRTAPQRPQPPRPRPRGPSCRVVIVRTDCPYHEPRVFPYYREHVNVPTPNRHPALKSQGWNQAHRNPQYCRNAVRS